MDGNGGESVHATAKKMAAESGWEAIYIMSRGRNVKQRAVAERAPAVAIPST